MLSTQCSFIHILIRAVMSPFAERVTGRGSKLGGASFARSANRLLVLGLAVASLCMAQEYRGTLSGLVTDPQSAAMPGVKVLATQTETGSKYNTVSSGDGRYTIPLMLPGTYSVEAESAGFKRYVRTGIRISTNESVSVDIGFELGATTETVTVSSEAPMLDTTTASVGSVVNQRQVEDMPLQGRNPYYLAQLAMGVIQTAGGGLAPRPFDNGSSVDMSVGGAPNRRNELLLDGQPNISEDGTMGWAPPVDALQEVKVENFQSDAAYGHTGGGTVSATTKGGTNEYHGTAYEFNQNSALNAANFFVNRTGNEKPKTLWNQWGASLGGPVRIPGVYNGKDKLFFYVIYEGIKNRDPETGYLSVPTIEERTGDFSKLLAVKSSYQIYDPYSGVVKGSNVSRQPFPGNIIPANSISPIAANILKYYPLPNQPGTADGTNNYFFSQFATDTFDTELGRLDYNLGDKHKLMFDFRHNDRPHTTNDRFGNGVTGYLLTEKNWGASFDEVYTITPTTVLDVRFNWNRKTELRNQPLDGFSLTSLGFPAALANAVAHPQFPSIDISGLQSFGYEDGRTQRFDNWQIFSTVNRVIGKHMLKAGADLRQVNFGRYQWGDGAGSYDFSSDWTRGPLNTSASAPTGQGLASLLLGLPTGGSMVLPPAESSQNRYLSFFLQDDIRVNSSLSLNFGLRYERELAPTERYNRMTRGFDLTSPNAITAAAQAAYALNPIPEVSVAQFKPVGGLLFADASNRSPLQTSALNFSPRFGFAYSPSALGGKTVFRGGFGVFFNPNLVGGTAIDQTGFTSSTPLVRTLDGGLTPAATIANPFPNGLIPALGSSLGLDTNLGQSVSFNTPEVKNAYSVRWNFNIQRQLPLNMVGEVGYEGNHFVHMWNSRSLNFVPNEYLSTSATRDQATINYLSANVTNPFAGLLPGTSLNGSKISRSALLSLYPSFSQVKQSFVPEGSSYFHMLMMRLQKRFSHGLQSEVNYSHSKLMGRTSRLNNGDTQLEKVIQSEDRPNRLVASASWELPVGTGKLVGTNRALNRVVGGWSVNFIYTMQSGQLLGWGNLIYYGGDLNLDPRNLDHAFDTTRFNRNSGDQLGSNLRTFPSRFANLRYDRQNTWNVGFLKNIAITEQVRAQLRGEFFNFFNHPVFSGANTSPTNSKFGTINSQFNTPRNTQLGLKLIW